MANKKTNEKNQPNRKKLRDNEYYNPKTRRYEYRYKDALGKTRVVSSYKLESTDQVPKGKKSGLSLREKESEINAILKNGLDIDGSKLTLNELMELYFNHLCNRKELKPSAINLYRQRVKTLRLYSISHMEIGKIKPIHGEEWFTIMKANHRLSTVQQYASLIKGAMEYAIDNDYISKNPFKNMLTSQTFKTRDAITSDSMLNFLDFCKTDKCASKHYNLFYFLFWTGLRASELCGLTLDNLDMENRIIRIDKQLWYYDGKDIVVPPKSDTSIRYIPMTDGVYECLQHIIRERKQITDEPVCYDMNGKAYEGFIFLKIRGHNVMSRYTIYRYLKNSIDKYNRFNPENQLEVSPHICRHTFATNMQDLPVKTLQTILGHSNISITLNTYVKPKPVLDQSVEMNRIAEAILEG